MKVTYVSTLPHGGPVSHVADLADEVQAAGMDVVVLCGTPEVARILRARGLECVTLPLRHKLDLPGALRLRPYLRGSDVVHTHDRRAGLLARPQGRACGAKVVHTMHGIPDEIFVEVGRRPESVDGHASRAKLAWLRHGVLGIEAGLARLGETVVPSQALADYLIAHRFPREHMHVIPNGVKVQRDEPARVREPLVLGTAAVLDHRKGVDVLLRACKLAGVPLRLEVFGIGDQRRRLEDLATELGVAASFHGHVTNVRERLPELDVFVLASRAENLPMAILEAMAAALPVLATRVGGIPEVVEDEVTGLLVEPDDAAALARAITRLAQSPELAQRLGRAGARRAAESFDAGIVARRMVGLYEELCASSK